MVNPRQTIEVQGVVVNLLITPSLYKRSLTDGLDLTLHNPDDTAEVWGIYVKHVYLAYLNAIDVAAYDGHQKPKKMLELADFEAWAAGEGKTRFGELMRQIVEFKTGKTLEELAAEGKGQDGKKKEQAKRFRWWRRGSRVVTSS
jgi:hypothetical protein